MKYISVNKKQSNCLSLSQLAEHNANIRIAIDF